MPDELRRLEQRELSCVACHGTGAAPSLAPEMTALPSVHPPLPTATR